MKNKHIFWGILLISLGALILLNNISSHTLYFREVWKLWPAVLILWGISLIIKQTVVRGVLVALTAFTLALAVYSSFRVGFRIFDYSFSSDDHWEEEWDGKYESHSYTEAYTSNIETAVLNFDAGAGSFFISDNEDSSAQLFTAKTYSYLGDYTLNRYDGSKETTIDFMMKKKKFSFRDGNVQNRVEMNLNPNPVWDINLNVGASSNKLDLSSCKLGKLKVGMGAASLDIKLGEPVTDTYVEIDAGVSSIDILIPENAACAIKADVSLSSTNFPGFDKIGDKEYRSENYNNSSKKIFIDLSTGVSSISVKRGSEW